MTTHLAMAGGAEFDAIRSMLSEWGVRASGIGDDGALLDVPAGERLVVSTDATVEDVHFRRGWLTSGEIGARAATAALSDLAAMGARPIGLLLALGLPEDWQAELRNLARGVGDSAAACACPIVGGNISASERLSLTITVLGGAAAPLARSGARSGDIIFVTGHLGGPAAALSALLRGEEPRADHRERFAAPMARIAEARWLAEQGVHAAIDLSDGLLSDAAHLANASGTTLEIDADLVPRMTHVSGEEALAGGEEYELLVAMPPGGAVATISTRFKSRFGIPLTRIGHVSPQGAGAVLVHGVPAPGTGHDHLESHRGST